MNNKDRWRDKNTTWPRVLENIKSKIRLAVINPPKHHGRYDLRFIDLNGLDLTGYDFTNCDLGQANFEGCILKGTLFNGSHLANASFRQAVLTNTQFVSACLMGAHLEEAECDGANFNAACLYNAYFQKARLVDANFETCLLRGIDLNEVVLQDPRGFLPEWPVSKVKDEQIGDWHGAAKVYWQLRQALEASGARHEAGELFYKWRCCRRHTLTGQAFIKDTIIWSLLGYGEKPWWTIGYAIGIILLFALLYCGTDVYVDGQLMTRKNQEAISALEAQQVNIGLREAIYYSAVTFTTLGYGDVSPDLERIEQLEKRCAPWFRTPCRWFLLLVPTVEAFFGAVLISLFTVAFARKVIRSS